VLRTPFPNSSQRRTDHQTLDDSISDVDALAANEAPISGNPPIFFGADQLVSSTPAFSNGASGSTPVAQLKDPIASSTLPNVKSAPAVTIADGGSAEIVGVSAQSVTFTGTTGTLNLADSLAFTGEVAGLAGSDAIDLADVSYGVQTQVTFLGNATGGTLTITDGLHTANIALQGDYLTSTWTLSSDGNGGTDVVDPVSSNTWQNLAIGAGGFGTGLDIAPDGLSAPIPTEPFCGTERSGCSLLRQQACQLHLWSQRAVKASTKSRSLPAIRKSFT
jgi:hypothetical protein